MTPRILVGLTLLLTAVALAAPRLVFTHCEILQVAAGERRGHNVPTVRVVLQNTAMEAATDLTLRLMKGDDPISEFGPVTLPPQSKTFFTWQLQPGERQNMQGAPGRRSVQVTQSGRILATAETDLRDPDYLKSQGIDPSPAPEPSSPAGY